MSAPYRTSEESLRAEVERLTRELATLRERRPRGRWGWRDYLAGPIILGGFPIGTGVIFAARAGMWAWLAAMLAGYLWWAWALRYARSDR